MPGTTTNGNLIDFPYSQRLSWKKKKAYNFKWAEDMCDYYDYYYGLSYMSKKQEKFDLNYNLFNGRGEEAMELYAETLSNQRLMEMGIDTGYQNIQHHDIISQIGKAMVGEQKQRPLKLTVVDTSSYAMNQRKHEKVRLLMQYLNETIIQPANQQAMQEYMQEMGIQDPYSLSPEQQQQMQADVQNRAAAKTPDEIKNYMQKVYKTPSEKQAQKLLDYLSRQLNLKWVTDEGFKHAVITGEEIYRIRVRHHQVYLDLVNAKGFTYSARPNTFFIEEGEWAKYEESIKYSDLFNEFGDQMTRKDYEKIDRLFHGVDNAVGKHETDSSLVQVMERLPEGALEKINPRTKDGQQWLKDFYHNTAYKYAQADLRKAHIVWKSLRKMKYITRIEQDSKVGFWVDESYTFNELKGDIEEKIVWIPEVWETTKIGTADALYFDKRPIPYQYKSLQNPWDVKLPYYGAQYSRLMGNAENVSPIDLGKPWQFKFNVQMARLQEMEQTDLGKILLTTTGAIPQEYDPGTFFSMMKYGKMAQLDLSQEGVSAYDAQFFKAIDLSNQDKIASQVSYLQFLQQQVAVAMSYNSSRLGQVSPYTPVTNNQQNIVQSSFQTEDIYSTHAQIVENLANGLINAARVAFKHNPVRASFLLDDMSLADLELDWEMLNTAELGIFASNRSEDHFKLEQVRQQAQSMIQNGLITFPELIKLTYATSGSEILNMAELADQKRELQQQQAQQAQAQQQQQMLQQQMQMQKEMLQFKAQLDALAQDKELQYKYTAAQLQSMEMANAYDINKNQLSDIVERAILQYAHEQEEKAKDRELERDKLEMKTDLERDKLKMQRDSEKEKNEKQMRIEKEKLRTQEKVARMKVRKSKTGS